MLGSYGYDGMQVDSITQTLPGMQALMSWIPACFGIAGALLIMQYPLTDARQQEVTETLLKRRSATA